MPAPTRAVSPVFRASLILPTSKGVARACADPLFDLPFSGGRSPSARVALALATPGLADGQGCRRGARPAPNEANEEINHVDQFS
jgi:hypothetical protein